MDGVDPARMTAEQAADLLSSRSVVVPVSWVLRDIEDGLPLNPDGTINLIVYAAWLTREQVAHS